MTGHDTQSLASHCERKFKKRIGAFKSRFLRNKQEERSILVAFSGGISSTALLDLAVNRFAPREGQKEPVSWKIIVVFIVENDNHLSLSWVNERYPHVLVKKIPVDSIFSSSTKICSLTYSCNALHYSTAMQSPSTVSSLLLSIPSVSARVDINRYIKQNLLLSIAKQENCCAIFWGDSRTRLASKILENTINGRGYSLPWETSPFVEMQKELYFVRPMVDIVWEEMQEYLVERNISYSQNRELCNGPTISRLTSNYFTNLEKDYPSLVGAIVRTSGKLAFPPEAGKCRCRICGMPREDSPSEWLEAITVNEPAPDESESSTTLRLGDDDIFATCYGCLVAFRGCKDLLWPVSDAWED